MKKKLTSYSQRPTRLALQSETVRTLTASELELVHAGDGPVPTKIDTTQTGASCKGQ